MIRQLVQRAVSGAIAAAAAFVAVVFVGVTIFFALSLVLLPVGAAAITAGLFALIAVIAYLIFAGKAGGADDDDGYDDEPESLAGRVMHFVQQRPVIGIVGALAAGALLIKKPGLAALAMTAFNDSGRQDKRSGSSRGYSRSSGRNRRR